MKILMVCLGNICRSPLAEGVLRDKAEKAGLRWEIDSAGTYGHNVGCNPHHMSQRVARENGIDISHLQCRNFKKEDILHFDKIYVMDDENYADVKRISREYWDKTKVDYLLNELYPGENRQVIDPWYGGEEDFYKVHKQIDKACEAIVQRYGVKAFNI